MKLLLSLSLITLISTAAHANTDCTAGIAKALSNLAPRSGEVKITGKYTKKSESGEYKACSLSIKLEDNELVPSFTNETFDPLNGDGGAFWPFGKYPTAEISSNEYERLVSYECSAGAGDFSIDYTYKSLNGWHKKSRYTLGLEKNSDGTYSASLRAGNGSVKSKLVTCKGIISEE